MIDRETWVILGDRLVEIREARVALEAEAEPIHLEFDAHDQAKVVPGMMEPSRA
jgi:hypothetical protein